MNIFVDTSGFIAVLDRDEANHSGAAEAWQNILSSPDALVTTNYVLVETCALVQNRLGMEAIKVFQADIVPVLQIEWIDSTVHLAAMGTMLAAARKKLSLVDCVSFEIMRLFGITAAFTLDRHFKEQGFICLPA
jgi:predicted nucleic acid-binding protein